MPTGSATGVLRPSTSTTPDRLLCMGLFFEKKRAPPLPGTSARRGRSKPQCALVADLDGAGIRDPGTDLAERRP